VARRFISQFLLPLVRGGTLHVGRPLSVGDVHELIQSTVTGAGAPAGESRLGEQRAAPRWHAAAAAPPEVALSGEALADPVEREAASALAAARRERLAELSPRPELPPLDPATWRLGAVVHNLLAMSHPVLASGPGAEGRLERIAAVTVGLAKLGPPVSARDALARHSVVARFPEVIRHDHTVRHHLGKQTFVGHRPPGRALALGRLRGIRVESARRTWLRDVGVPGVARATFLALSEASPLGEALDPLRLDPPPSWGRLLSVLRFPSLCRAVAGRLQTLGVPAVGDALTAALYRFASLQDGTDATKASAAAIGYGIQFLAHLVWLDLLFGSVSPDAPAGGGGRSPLAPDPPAPGAAAAAAAAASDASVSGGATSASRRRTPLALPARAAGRELAILLVAAEDVQPLLVWPPDISPSSALGRRFAAHLDHLSQVHDVRHQPRWPSAFAVAEFAVSAPGPGDNGI
jgi:hypothetical protein